ncbi:type II toxin-antitoxin system VapC family toxin [Streptomyces sp. NBC_01808]|uniref:type II toxin-antitoxin system VapC family toxin n=1 Tax=Streptomyces sp. NBC_01808 TaxID=2975947 RepID=UPI002DDC5594|nr:type II toxin-antitoxin system VapC family toxin [Streptomyces sp. NBC_01808]WSA40539.1 type II toxin-antitoxin system VapC family toxin [Streptomyces sp. NBC_01808]
MIYLDASAVITLIAGRRHAAELRGYLEAKPAAPLATSTIGFVETVRTLDRMGSFPTAMQDLMRDLTEVLVTEEVRDLAGLLPGRVRTLDAVHVASAQTIGPALDSLISYDKRMLEVAREVGLPTAAPGMD